MAKILLILPISWSALLLISCVPIDESLQATWSYLAWSAYGLAILGCLAPVIAVWDKLPLKWPAIEKKSSPLYQKKIEELILVALFVVSSILYSIQVLKLGEIPILNPLMVNTLRVQFALPVLHHGVMLVNYCIFFISYQFFFSSLYYRKTMILILTASMFIMISYGTKAGTLFAIAPIIYCYIRKHGFNAKAKGFALLGVALVAASQVFRSYAELSAVEDVSPFYESIKTFLMNFVMQFENFAHWIENDPVESYGFGRYIFFAPLAVLQLRTSIEFPWAELWNAHKNELAFGGGQFNTLPMIMSPYNDFGVAGIPFYFLAVAILGIYIIRKYTPGNRFSELTVFYYLFIMSLSFYGDFFADVTFYYNLLACIAHLQLTKFMREIGRVRRNSDSTTRVGVVYL